MFTHVRYGDYPIGNGRVDFMVAEGRVNLAGNLDDPVASLTRID